ncbi:MAG: hypothetical protein KatS3mg125_2130 [Lysobacterales bacterium]|jgi:hypothetical protein|nr:MAG: hypothetical protein KatS3mg125_2130 [Xanthomonadales bacterium]
MVTKLFVEGGGHGRRQNMQLRRAMSELLRNAGLAGCMPRVVASGNRQNTIDDYGRAKKDGDEALVLVDSEQSVPPQYCGSAAGAFDPWGFLSSLGMKVPPHRSNPDCHLMVECMENWFVADWGVVQRHFRCGQQPPGSATAIEQIPKANVLEALDGAAGQRGYDKTGDGFSLLQKLNPAKVAAASPWAKRFFDELRKRCANRKGCRGHPPGGRRP